MDPNTTLEVIRQAILYDSELDDHRGAHNRAIVEHFTALDEWLSRGGFLPDAWARSDVIREIKAEAWDQGEEAGRANADDGYPDPFIENPHRPHARGSDFHEPDGTCRHDPREDAR